MDRHVERHIKPRVLEALADTRIVVIQGARQVGKTTFVRDIVGDLGGLVVSLDDRVTAAAAGADPAGFLRQNPGGLLAIDEVQRVPDLVLALKYEVDADPRPGRFLLTGSANLRRLPAAQDSLAGRTESIELHGFSQGELTGHVERFIDAALGGELPATARSDLTRADYLERATAGGYPEALARPPGRRRSQWIGNYLDAIVERDVPDVTGTQRGGDLPLILRAIAAQDADELNISDLASQTEIPTSSLRRLVDLLEAFYLIQRIPAWATNLTKRVVSRPKAALLDTGLAARLVNVSATGARPETYGALAGHLLEGFVAGELRRQRVWADESVRISHFRDRTGAEVDLVLETPDGRVVGLEVKATSRIGPHDARWLSMLRDRLGRRFVAGIILHTGATGGPFGDRIVAAPIETLWTT